MGQQVFIKCEGNSKKELKSKIIKEIFSKIPEAQRSNDEQIEGIKSGRSNSCLLQKSGMTCR